MLTCVRMGEGDGGGQHLGVGKWGMGDKRGGAHLGVGKWGMGDKGWYTPGCWEVLLVWNS